MDSQIRWVGVALDPIPNDLLNIIENEVDSTRKRSIIIDQYMETHFQFGNADLDSVKTLLRHCTSKLSYGSDNSLLWRHLRAICNFKLGYYDRAAAECQDILKKEPGMSKVTRLVLSCFIQLGKRGFMTDVIITCLDGLQVGEDDEEIRELESLIHDSTGFLYTKLQDLMDGKEEKIPFFIDFDLYQSLKRCPVPSVPWDVAQIGPEERAKQPVDPEQKRKAHELKLKGDMFVRQKQFVNGFRLYSEALKYNPYDTYILSNRAITAYMLKLYGQAWSDASHALKWDLSNIKALYCIGYASIKMNQYKNTIQMLKALSQMTSVSREMKKAVSMLQELMNTCQKQHETGEGYEDVYSEKIALIGEYTGPVEVVFIPGKARGLIATKNIMPGQLILASKAIASVPLYKPISDPTRELTREILKVVHFQKKKLLPLIYHLWAGAELEFLDAHNEEHEEQCQEVDFERIRKVCYKNAFRTKMRSKFPSAARASDPIGMLKDTKLREIFGLWHLPSYINHCCWGGNAHWIVYEDIMFIRALREIQPGDEITMNTRMDTTICLPPNKPLASATMKDDEIRRCCPLCELDSKETEDIQKQRIEMIQLIEDWSMFPLSVTMDMFERMEKLRDNKPELNIPLLTLIHLVIRRAGCRSGRNVLNLPLLMKMFTRAYELTIGTPSTAIALRMMANARNVIRPLGLGTFQVHNLDKDEMNSELLDKFEEAHLLMYGTKTIFHPFYSKYNRIWA